jgi:hypothetical protein
MALGSQTSVVNGQRVDTPTSWQFNPSSYGVQTTGVPQVSPTMPPYMGGGGGVAAMGGAEGVGGYGTAGNNQQTTAIAAAHPWNAKVSPVVWAVGALIGGLVLLDAIHWRKTILEGSESGTVGAAREEASAGV